MKNIITATTGIIGGIITTLFGGWDIALQTLVLFMVIDWITGGIILPGVFKKSPKSENGRLEGRDRRMRRLDSAGTQVVTYRYNSWEKPLAVSDSTAEKIGSKNSFRCRGCCLDEETGQYRSADCRTGKCATVLIGGIVGAAFSGINIASGGVKIIGNAQKCKSTYFHKAAGMGKRGRLDVL